MKVRGESRPSVDARCPESESLELDEHVTLLPVSLNLPPKEQRSSSDTQPHARTHARHQPTSV